MQTANPAILGAAPVFVVRQLQGSNMDPNADYPEFCRSFESRALLGNYTASSGNSLPKFKDNLSVPFEDGADSLSWNLSKELPLLAA